MTLVGVGHALADVYAFVGEDVPKLFGLHPGSYNQVPDYRMRAFLETLNQKSLVAGGSAANVVKLAARLGVRGHFVGQCGSDEAGRTFAGEMLEAGVRIHLVPARGPTGLSVTFLVPSQDRTVATFRSSSGNLATDLVDEGLVQQADLVLVSGYLLDEADFVADLVGRCRAAQTGLAFHIADRSQVDRHAATLQAYLASGVVQFLHMPEAEAPALTGLDATDSLAALGNQVPVVVFQRDDRGWLVRAQGRTEAIPLAGSVSVDSSGCADGFVAGYLWATDQGRNPFEAARAGSLVAGCIAGQPGTRVEPTRWNRLITDLQETAVVV